GGGGGAAVVDISAHLHEGYGRPQRTFQVNSKVLPEVPMRNPFVISCFLVTCWAGCGASKKPNSTVSAAAALDSYPARPSAAAAIDERGQAVTSGIDTAGHFSLTLPRDHRYRIALALADREVPVVFARGSGRFGTSFSIVSGGAQVDLGSLRY